MQGREASIHEIAQKYEELYENIPFRYRGITIALPHITALYITDAISFIRVDAADFDVGLYFLLNIDNSPPLGCTDAPASFEDAILTIECHVSENPQVPYMIARPRQHNYNDYTKLMRYVQSMLYVIGQFGEAYRRRYGVRLGVKIYDPLLYHGQPNVLYRLYNNMLPTGVFCHFGFLDPNPPEFYDRTFAKKTFGLMEFCVTYASQHDQLRDCSNMYYLTDYADLLQKSPMRLDDALVDEYVRHYSAAAPSLRVRPGSIAQCRPATVVPFILDGDLFVRVAHGRYIMHTTGDVVGSPSISVELEMSEHLSEYTVYFTFIEPSRDPVTVVKHFTRAMRGLYHLCEHIQTRYPAQKILIRATEPLSIADPPGDDRGSMYSTAGFIAAEVPAPESTPVSELTTKAFILPNYRTILNHLTQISALASRL